MTILAGLLTCSKFCSLPILDKNSDFSRAKSLWWNLQLRGQSRTYTGFPFQFFPWKGVESPKHCKGKKYLKKKNDLVDFMLKDLKNTK
ncbi:MAG: hypothetical protein H6Q14_759 [Bacteroidetes bacterium]|jgi:hypothetical protein|nr:hypothetical protein [Bacteroidota bacterium]